MVEAAATGPEAGTKRGPRPWPRTLRWAVGIGVLLVLALIAGLTASVIVVRQSWPQTSGTLRLSALEGSVQVIRDSSGIPQIYADTTHDLMLAQGFVAAQDRFFEMDVRRHATAGRLSEMFGKAGLESDLVVRTLGWRQIAEEELPLLSPATRSALDAYAEGVNAYLEGRSPGDMSLEYALLGLTGLDYKPEKWTAVDSIAWLKAMAWDLRGNLDEEIGRALSAAVVGPQRAGDLYPAYPFGQHPPIVQQGGVRAGRFDQNASGAPAGLARPPLDQPDAVRVLDEVRAVVDAMPPLLGRGDGIGSNAWVVDGKHTDSGAPILANDPHLGVSLPGVWTQVGLHCRELSAQCPYDVAGFSFSGVPGVVIGHNRDIAWGLTNLGPDVTDLYVERVTGDDWEFDGQRLPLTLRPETIKVRDGKDVDIVVRSTTHGPLLSDIARYADQDGVDLTDDGVVDQVHQLGSAGLDDGATEHAVSLAWTALTPHPTADALLALDRATDWASFRSALSDFAAPGQNVVYADTDGHIGYQATGLVPIRRAGNDGRLPAAGWRRDTDWTGRFIPYDELPNVLDPASGIIATANQAVIDPSRYAPYLTSDWDQGYRSDRIGKLLAADDALSADAMRAIQLDDRSAIGELLTPYLLEVKLPRGYYSDGQKLLRSWNYQQDADSAAAAYFNAVWREVLHRTFADELPKGLQPDGSDRWFTVMAKLLPRARAGWWDDINTDDKVERRTDILREAMIAARDDLTALESPDTDEWSWGGIHQLELRSSTLGESGIGIVEWLFNRGGWDVGGGGSLVNATAWDARDGYDVVTAPSMRMVVPMDDLDASRWINLTGVSGHAFNPHYTDQTDLWARGDYLPWVFSEKAVRKAGEDVLTLKP
ncbi:penicillin acylase family protein [Nocardioides ginsengisoli]|uniref:Penicillin acylase family protein n=1 Tax=Nocardioides ginsengisoli TaxID=363868 RepID=A0ABW3VWS3_9ACTN